MVRLHRHNLAGIQNNIDHAFLGFLSLCFGRCVFLGVRESLVCVFFVVSLLGMLVF